MADRTVTVEITADTTKFVQGMQRVNLATIDLQDRRRVRMFDQAAVAALNFEQAMQSIFDALAEHLLFAPWPVNWVLGAEGDVDG